MGLSLVACSSNEPETKVAEEKEEKKKELVDELINEAFTRHKI